MDIRQITDGENSVREVLESYPVSWGPGDLDECVSRITNLLLDAMDEQYENLTDLERAKAIKSRRQTPSEVVSS